MKLNRLQIHNFRSILDADIEVDDYMLMVGANNAGKSTILNALRVFYDDIKWGADDFPKISLKDDESWVQLTFKLDIDEWDSLADKYKQNSTEQHLLSLRRYFKSNDKSRLQKDQSNIFGIIDEELDSELFYGAKNVGAAKIGQVLYVPAMSTPSEQMKTSGPSPLRNMLNFLLKKVVSSSDAYKKILAGFEKLNDEAREENGFLSKITAPLNAAISSWNVKIDLTLNPVTPEDISKSLVKHTFVDESLGNIPLDIDKYGHGFQRSVIYELIRLAPSFKDEKKSTKKEYNPVFNLILFEEPEAFLHPSQQENMAHHLRRLAAEEGQQIIITTHSPIFAGKATEEINRLIRVERKHGTTRTFQLKRAKINELLDQGGNLLKALQVFVDNPNISDNNKKHAKNMIANPPQEQIALQEEQFRFQLWLDGERSSLFFAEKVLLVEGASEKALFNYLLANNWYDFNNQRICIIDVLGKFNFHRYMALLEAYGIPHGIILDDDSNGKNCVFHKAVNDLVETSVNNYTLNTPVKLLGCLESFLGLPPTAENRNDKKPIEIMKAITTGQISAPKLEGLRTHFCNALKLTNLKDHSIQ